MVSQLNHSYCSYKASWSSAKPQVTATVSNCALKRNSFRRLHHRPQTTVATIISIHKIHPWEGPIHRICRRARLGLRQDSPPTASQKTQPAFAPVFQAQQGSYFSLAQCCGHARNNKQNKLRSKLLVKAQTHCGSIEHHQECQQCLCH